MKFDMKYIATKMAAEPTRWKITKGGILYFLCWCERWHKVTFLHKKHRRSVDTDEAYDIFKRRLKNK